MIFWRAAQAAYRETLPMVWALLDVAFFVLLFNALDLFVLERTVPNERNVAFAFGVVILKRVAALQQESKRRQAAESTPTQ